MKKNISSIIAAVALTGAALSIGCDVPDQVLKGIAYRSSGINYVTATYSGTTDANGSFDYAPGETITFSIGDIVLGSVVAGGNITPLELAKSDIVNNQEVINIARFLETLDSTQNDAIIAIDANAHTCASNVTINFDQTSDDFAADATVSAYLGCAKGVAVVTLSDRVTVVDKLERVLGNRAAGRAFRHEINDGTGGNFQNFIRGSGFRTGELAGTCIDFNPVPVMSSILLETEICFGADGNSGTATVFGTEYTFTWSVDADAGLIIEVTYSGSNYTIRLARLADGKILRRIRGLPNFPDLDILGDLR